MEKLANPWVGTRWTSQGRSLLFTLTSRSSVSWWKSSTPLFTCLQRMTHLTTSLLIFLKFTNHKLNTINFTTSQLQHQKKPIRPLPHQVINPLPIVATCLHESQSTFFPKSKTTLIESPSSYISSLFMHKGGTHERSNLTSGRCLSIYLCWI